MTNVKSEDRLVILLVDDDEDEFILVRDWLSTSAPGNYRILWADTPEKSLEILAAGPIAAVLIDYDLGGFSGVELIQEIYQRGYSGPTVMLTGRGGYEVDLGAMRAGVTDYVSKNETSPRELERTIRYAIEHQKNVEALRRANEMLAQARDDLELRVQERTEELRESQTLFERLFESAPDATVLLDTSGSILQVNQQTVYSFGYSRSELVGCAFTMLLNPEHYAVFQSFLSRSRDANTQPHRLETDIAGRRKDLTSFPIELVTAPFTLSSSAGYICVVHDITQRKMMESELAEVPRRLLEGVEAERLRLAKELHDGPIQELYGVAFGLRSLWNEVGQADFTSGMRMEELLKRIYETIQTMRDISRMLRPPTLSPFGLEKTIRSYTDQFKDQHPGVEIRLDLQPDAQDLPETVRLVLFRIFQNALSNIARHANAERVDVVFSYDDTLVTLEIQDDGQGFDFQGRYIEMVRQGHLGLAGSNERAEAIGGRLEVISQPEQGTIVRVTAPIKGRISEVG